jgi:parvulin-like peptidyl-prolyl isomerase
MPRLVQGVLTVSLIGLLLASFTQAQQPQSSPATADDNRMQVLAVVNGQQITREQLSQEAVRRFGELVIENMINNQLILAQCQSQGIKVTAEDVNNELDRRAKKFGMSIEKYIELIGQERGVDEAKLRNEVIWTELALRRLASTRAEVTPDKIEARMDSEFGPKVQVRAIALNDETRARQVLAMAEANPEQFSRLAIDYSVDANSASVGGLLPPLRRNMGEPVLEQAAFALTPGAISPVISLADQFIILKCERQYPASELTEEQAAIARQRIADELREASLGDAAADMFKAMQEKSEIVNVINNPELSQKMPGVAAMVNGQKVTMEQVYDECLNKFGRDVLQSEINRTLILQRLQQDGLSVADEDLQREMARAAVEFGFVRQDGTADLDRWIANVTQNDSSKIEIYVNDEVWPTVAMKKVVARNVSVSDDDMQKGFEANFGPRVQVLAIVLQDQRTAQRVWEMAKANQTEKYFGELAHQYSVEAASRANYGEVPPIQMHGGRKVMEEEAFRLKPGDISGLIPVGQNWIILWCKGRTTPVVQEFDAVKDELYRDILEKKMRIAMAEEFERLLTTSQIDNFLVGSSQPGGDAVRAARNQPPGAAGNR